jgi:hypothetical protein
MKRHVISTDRAIAVNGGTAKAGLFQQSGTLIVPCAKIAPSKSCFPIPAPPDADANQGGNDLAASC